MTTVEMKVTPSQPVASSQTWGWWEAVIIHLAVLLVAFTLQWKLTTTGGITIMPPWNWIIMGGLAGAGLVLGAVFRTRPWMRWLSGARFAIVAIVAVSILAVIGTLVIQQPGNTEGIGVLGFRHIFASVPFLAMFLLMLINLSTVLGRRLCARRQGDLGFILNHAGMIVIIVGIVAGSSHLVMARVHLHEGIPTDTAFDDANRAHPLGATLTLDRFEIEWFPPQLQLATMRNTSGAHDHRISSHQIWVEEGQQFTIEGIQGRILQFFPSAAFDHEQQTMVYSEQDFGITAAEVEYTAPGGDAEVGWIISGRGVRAPVFIMVDEQRMLYMTNPMPRAYRSFLTMAEDGEEEFMTKVGVNSPLGVNGWVLYQSSYAYNEMTDTMDSILQAVYDPALPIIYVGFIALLFGAFVTFWAPMRRKEDTDAVSETVTAEEMSELRDEEESE